MRKFILIYLLLLLSLWSVSSKILFIDKTVKKINKNSFIFGNENYTEWNKWSECSADCKRFRERFCVQKPPKKENKSSCRVKIIREIIACKKHSKCFKNDYLALSQKTLSTLPKNCGLKPMLKEVNHKIFGGYVAQEHSWPWNLAFQYQTAYGGYTQCSATLISPQWAITAAHCVYYSVINGKILGKLTPFIYHYAYVIVGNYHRDHHDNNQQKVYLSHFIIHPNFRHGILYTDYDFAILRLENSIKQDSKHGFACISEDKNFHLPKDFQCYGIGWGEQGSKKAHVYDDRLQEVKLPLTSYEQCKSFYGNIYINYTIHTCAGGNKRDTCIGDSGGGLFCLHPYTKRWMLYGVVSFGLETDCGDSIGVYAKVSGALQWIDDTIRLTEML